MKHKILDMLYQQVGNHVSGQEICDKNNCTRSSIWKHIKGLKKEGYLIHSAPHKGYQLKIRPDLLNLYELRRYISLDIPIYYQEYMESTNDQAKQIAEKQESDFLVVACGQQKQGKGRLGRTFLSNNSLGCWVSYVLRPRAMTPEEASFLTIAAGVAVCKTLSSLYPTKPQIKWPNDIIINQKKCCGILCEASMDLDFLNYVVVGVGMNVLHQPTDFDQEIQEIATSLFIETGIKHERAQLIGELTTQMSQIFKQLKNGEKYDILNQWKAFSLSLNKEIIVIRGQEKIKGKALDIDEKGRLIVQLEDQSIKKYHSGEISIRGVMEHK